MNAYELTDLLDFDARTLNWKAFADAATMLRQQFDTIADLQTTIKFLEEECKTLRNQVTKTIEAQEK
jgi:hypothetical protein